MNNRLPLLRLAISYARAGNTTMRNLMLARYYARCEPSALVTQFLRGKE